MDPSFPEAAICNSNVNDTIFAACLKTIQNSYCSSQAPLAEEGDKRHTCESQLTNIEGGDQRGSTTHTILGRHSDDGYNWRKYGQKQVKGSEYPRSYYKCTHPNCQVKKKVERAHDGQTTEIVYKGDHNHPKPLPSRRSGAASMHLNHDGEENAEAAGSLLKAELSGTCRNTDSGIFKSRDTDCSRMWKNERTERSLSTSVVTDLSDPSSTAQVQSSMCIDSQGTPEPSSNLATDDDMDDGGTNDSISFEDNSDGEEQESKRRKREQSSPDQMAASRAMHERRVVVQTTSEIDILDDGYRWRKYGQKLVKGNPNPRSYYKCTNAGCPVRKHVERASHDVKSVITTYEVKHNHGVPAARNSNPVSATKANSTVPAPVQAIVAAPPNTISHSMTQAKDIVSHFDRQFDPGSNFGTHPFLGKMMEESIHLHDNSAIRMDTKIGAAINFGMFGLEGCQSERQQIIEGTSCVEMQMPGASSHGLATFGVNPGQPIASVKLNTDVRSLRPKEEQKADSSFGNLLSYSPQMNAILYEKLLGHLPKGP